jgi:hypothetical protein
MACACVLCSQYALERFIQRERAAMLAGRFADGLLRLLHKSGGYSRPSARFKMLMEEQVRLGRDEPAKGARVRLRVEARR